MVKKMGSTSRKHVPTRTCIVCRQSLPKRELLRIVRTPEGAILFDPTGKRAGRGAYLCRQRSCWDGVAAKRRLSHALNATPTPEEWECLAVAVAPWLGDGMSDMETACRRERAGSDEV